MINNFMSSISKYVNRMSGWKDKLFLDIKGRSEFIVSETNNLNNKMAASVGLFAEGVSDIRSRMSNISNMYLTISTISGNSNTEFSILNMPVHSNRNILIQKNRLKLITETFNPVTISNVSVLTNGSYGNTSDFEDKRNANPDTLISSTPFEVERINGAVSLTTTISLRDKSLINNISFNYSNFGIDNPSISHVEISEDGKLFRRISFIEEQSGDSVDLIIDDSSIRAIRFTAIQNKSYVSKLDKVRYAIGISDLSVGLASSAESGSIVFGPLTQASEILKASISASIPTDGYSFANTVFEISHNNNDWYRVSTPFSLSDYPKHIDFNNISENSVKTENPVTTLFLRITMNGSESQKRFNFDSINRHTQTLNSINPYITAPFNISDKYVLGKSYGYTYGVRSTYNSFYDNLGLLDTATSIRSGNDYLVKSISSKGQINKATIRSFMHKCSVEEGDAYRIIPSQDMDIGTVKAYKVSNPIKRAMRVSESNNVILPFKQDAGIYRLTDGSLSRDIDLRSGFFSSCYQWIYEPHNKDVYLIDHMGFKVHTFDRGRHINLLDYFEYEEPTFNESTVHKVVLNKDYPMSNLNDGEFTIVDNRLYSSNTSAIVDCHSFTSDEIELMFKSNINSISIYTEDAKFSKASEILTKYDGLKAAKLNKSGLLKGSVKFKNNDSSLMSFVREVQFINGIDEFNTGARVEVLIPKNVSEFSLGRLVDHFSDFNIIGYSDVFKSKVFTLDELVFEGDYLLEDRGNETFIILPENIKTHDIIDTHIVFDSSMSNAGNGYYSIDYNNGVLYSQSIISGNTEVEYIYSNVFITGSMISVLDKSEYNISGKQVQVSNVSDGDNFVLLSPIKIEQESKIFRSPTIKNLILNTVTI